LPFNERSRCEFHIVGKPISRVSVVQFDSQVEER
jgi:hypothetical protein